MMTVLTMVAMIIMIIMTMIMIRLEGRAKVAFNDGEKLDGFFKEGVLHGFARCDDGDVDDYDDDDDDDDDVYGHNDGDADDDVQ